MWEELKVYKQLDKVDINPTFKKFGNTLVSLLEGYSLEQTSSVIKLSRHINQLEQAVFVEKDKGTYNLKVRTSIKPVAFYRRHKFTMVNIVPLGDIMNNHRKTTFPLTKEWNDLATYLVSRIKTEVEDYFQKFNSYDKIIEKRKDIENRDFGLDNKYELLIYAAIKTRNKPLLNSYLKKKLSRSAVQISKSEYLKPEKNEVDEVAFLERVKELAQISDFASIEKEILKINEKE